MTDLFYEIYQSQQIASAKADAARASDKVSSVQDEISFLKKRFESLLLVNAALWEILKTKLDLTDSELKSMILEIDARDGKIDGRMSSVTTTCKKCGKTLHPKHSNCLYCGTDNRPISPIGKV